MNTYKIKRKKSKEYPDESYYYGTSVSYRLYPNKKQTEWLESVGDKCKRAYNDLVREFCENPDKPKNLPGTSLKEVGRLSRFIKQKDYLEGVPTVFIDDLCTNFIFGVDRFYKQVKKNKEILSKNPNAEIKKVSPPKKKKGRRDYNFGSMSNNIDIASTIDWDNNRLYIFRNILKKLGVSNCFKIKLHNKFKGSKIKRITFSRDSSLVWTLSLSLELPESVSISKKELQNNSLGIDLGVKTLVTTSEGVKYHPNVDKMKFIEKKIDTLNKIISRKRTLNKEDFWKSKNYNRVLRKKQILQNKLNNLRDNYSNYVSHVLTKGKYDKIQVEDLNMSFMLNKKKSNSNVSRAVSRLGMSSLVGKIKYKAESKGIDFNKVNPYNTSKSCSDCGEVNEDLTLDVRNWVCSKCGADHDRDINAAKNIKKSLSVKK